MRISRARHPVIPVLAAPIDRVADLPVWGKVWMTVVGAFQLLGADLFVPFFGLAVCTGALDWRYGRLAARKEGNFDRLVSMYGWHSKVAGFAVLIMLRLGEAGLQNAGILDTNGLFATAIAAALWMSELESLDGHRQTLGASPLPILGHLLHFLRGVVERLVPEPPAPPESEEKP